MSQAGSSQQQVEAYVTNVVKNVANLPKDAPETGDLRAPFVLPVLNICKAAESQPPFADEGFRLTNPIEWERVQRRFVPVKQGFSDNVGFSDRRFAKSR